MLIDLKDRTALVTGAGRSVGRGIAEVLASAGAFVYVNDLHAERADEVVAAIESNGGSARTLAFTSRSRSRATMSGRDRSAKDW